MSTELFSLEGKVAAVTGASRGLGAAIATGFAAAGADVALAARSTEALEALTKEIRSTGARALAVTTDVTDRSQLEALVERTVDDLGGLDVFVNNAGGAAFMAPIPEVRPAGWDRTISLNLDAAFHGTQLAARAMARSGGGSIIEMASIAGIKGARGLSFYSAAKGGLRLFAQAAARDLATSGVRVNVLAPGWIETDLTTGVRADAALRSQLEAAIPLGRFGTPDEVVGAAIFLASDASSFMTGATIVIDGGETA